METLKERYSKEIKPKLKERHGYKNLNEIPRLLKVTLNMGLAEAVKDKNWIQDALSELTIIAGQKAVLTMAKKSISNFKLREKTSIGAMVTLRGQRMYDFIERFFNIAAPRIRDFRGFKRKCDGRGNYTLGISDQQIFAELNLDLVKRQQGMHITFVTSCKTDEECISLLESLGLPFEEVEGK